MDKQIVIKSKQQDIPIRPRYGIPDELEINVETENSANNDEVASSYTEIPFALTAYVRDADQQEYAEADADEDDDTEDEQMENEKSFSPYKLRGSNNQFFQTNVKDNSSSEVHPILPQIDADVLNDIEIEAQYLATSVDNLLDNLCNLLQSISSITADSVEEQRKAVNLMTDSMDANIKCMYTIMAKTEEITKSMKPTEQLAQRIREIKGLVDTMESTL